MTRIAALRPALAAALLTALAAPPALAAQAPQQNRHSYEYRGRSYDSLAQCRAAKKRARDRGTVVGAATAGVGAALLGGNLGQSALIAGGGAVVGHELGKNSKTC